MAQIFSGNENIVFERKKKVPIINEKLTKKVKVHNNLELITGLGLKERLKLQKKKASQASVVTLQFQNYNSIS